MSIEIGYSSCKRHGASYRGLPKNFAQPKCSGRTQLCKEVLNDTLVSFPSWSEDSTFVSSRKTQYEEYIYRCEDERFELDVVIESNLLTIRVLEAVKRKMERLPYEDRCKFKLDDTLGGTSNVIHQRAIKRIYGDKAPEIIEGSKKNPVIAIPLILRRLKAKDEEWRDAQKQFNKIWRDQNEKYYMKSLDHQGITFKQNDIKFLRSKSLIKEIEDLRKEDLNILGGGDQPVSTPSSSHINLVHKDKDMLDVACNLIIHHVKRQTSIHKEEKQKIKQLMRHFIPDFFSSPRGDLSDDEMDNDEPMEDEINDQSASRPKKTTSRDHFRIKCDEPPLEGLETAEIPIPITTPSKEPVPSKSPCVAQVTDLADATSLFFVDNKWYCFFRLHHILCQRLGTIYEKARVLIAEEEKERKDRRESTAIALRLKPKNDIEVEDFFSVFLDMIKQLLDGNLDGFQYEDMLRDMFGIHAYVAFTLDKVVQNIVRQLQHIVADDVCQQCTNLYMKESRSTDEASYQKKIEQVLEDENCFKVIMYRPEAKLSIELLDTETISEDEDQEIENENAIVASRRFLSRNVRRYMARERRLKVNHHVKGRIDEGQCKFNPNDYRRLLIFNAGEHVTFYKRVRLSKAMQSRVNDLKREKFAKWNQRWLEQNPTT